MIELLTQLNKQNRRQKNKFRLWILLCLIVIGGLAGVVGLVALTPTEAATGINKQINYQGKMADSSGVALATGSYNFKFELYDASSGGNKLWEETWTSTTTASSVSVVSGAFSAALGTSTSLSTVDFNTDSIFLQIYLDADSNGSFEETFAPRKKLTSSPYAFNTDTVDGIHATTTATANQLLALDASAGMTLNSVTTTDSIYGGGYASTTGGLFTQGNGHYGGNLTIDGSSLQNAGTYLGNGITSVVKNEYGTEYAYHKLNDNLADTVIVDYTVASRAGALTGGSNTTDISEAGLIDRALHLDGTADFVLLENPSSGELQNTEGAMMLWANPDDDSGVDEFLMNYISISDVTQFYCKIDWSSGNNLHCGINIDSSTIWDWEGADDLTANIGSWTHFAIRHDGTSPIFYIDGVDVTSAGTWNDETDKTAWNYSLKIGPSNSVIFLCGGAKCPITRSNWFDGLIEDIRVFDIDITSADVATIYNSGAGLATGLGEDTPITINAFSTTTATLVDWLDGVNPDQVYFGDDVEIDGNTYIDGTLQTSLTENSIPFIGADGLLAENTSRFIILDDPDGVMIGIGRSPLVDLHIEQDADIGEAGSVELVVRTRADAADGTQALIAVNGQKDGSVAYDSDLVLLVYPPQTTGNESTNGLPLSALARIRPHAQNLAIGTANTANYPTANVHLMVKDILKVSLFPTDIDLLDDVDITGNASTTGYLLAGSYASSTTGLFTQGNGHIGGNLTIDGLATTTGNLTANNTLYVQDGSVGIGDSAPAYKLEIGGGDVNTTGGGYRDDASCVAGTCASDIRLKTDIEYFADGTLDKLMQLQPATFKFTDPAYGSTDNNWGLIAQEAEMIFPEWVVDNDDGYKGIRYGLNIQMAIIKSIQEQQLMIDELYDSLVVSTSTSATSTDLLVVDDTPDGTVDTLTVEQEATFYGAITVMGEAGFEKEVIFKDHITVNVDTAGIATIISQATSTEIIFEQPYQSVPIVVATLSDLVDTQFAVIDETVEGFRIAILDNATQDISFNWIALATSGEVAGAQAILGCMNPLASNYNEEATEDDGTCIIYGCMDSSADNYDETATQHSNTCLYSGGGVSEVLGCMDTTANNYNALATEDDGTCTYDEEEVATSTPIVIPPAEEEDVTGCMDNTANNYNAEATIDDGTCAYDPVIPEPVLGCMDNTANNYNAEATEDDGTCTYDSPPEEDPVPDPPAEPPIE